MLKDRIGKSIRVKLGTQRGQGGTIDTQVGHITAEVMKLHSQIPRQTLNLAVAALGPKFLKSVLVITPDMAEGTTVH